MATFRGERRTVNLLTMAGCVALMLPSGAAAGGATTLADAQSPRSSEHVPGCPGHDRRDAVARTLRGTTGADVIVTGGARRVSAKAGNDLICVTGRTRSVEAGSVTTSSRPAVGAPRPSRPWGPGQTTLSGVAAPTTSARADEATRRSTTSAPVAVPTSYDDDFPGPNQDLVDLGSGRDFALLDYSNLGGHLDGGRGLNTLHMEAIDETASWVVDNVTETATVNGHALFAWDNFRGFSFHRGSVDFRASDESEVVTAIQEFELAPTSPRSTCAVATTRW